VKEGHVGQVDLDQLGVHLLQLGLIGLAGDGLDQGVGFRVGVLPQLPFQLLAMPMNSELINLRMRPHGCVGPAPSLHIMKMS
jgi:hypothetical protein